MMLDRMVKLTAAHTTTAIDMPEYVVHRALIRTGEPIFWCAACGWEYGLARHEMAFSTLSSHKDLCARCFPELRPRKSVFLA